MWVSVKLTPVEHRCLRIPQIRLISENKKENIDHYFECHGKNDILKGSFLNLKYCITEKTLWSNCTRIRKDIS